MMGEDNQIYTKDEKVSSVNLFESYRQESLERDEELDYLEELRTFRDANPKEFRWIKELEEGLSLTRKVEPIGAYVVLDIDGHKNYLSVDSEVKPISFVEIAEVFRADRDEKSMKGKNREDYVQKAVGYFEEQIKNNQKERAEGRADGKREEEARSLLKEWLKRKIITRVEFKAYRESINLGNIGAIAIKEICKLQQGSEEEIGKGLKDIMMKQREVESVYKEDETIIKMILAMNLIEDSR
jgi:hypothetical protein